MQPVDPQHYLRHHVPHELAERRRVNARHAGRERTARGRPLRRLVASFARRERVQGATARVLPRRA